MFMIDFEKLDIIEVEEYLDVQIILDWNPSFLDESFRLFQHALEQKVENELDKHLLKQPVHFTFVTRFDNDDLDLIADNLVGAVVGYMSGAKRDREARLGRPKELDSVLMLDGVIMDCINNRLDTDIFTITLLNKHDKVFFSLLETVKQP
jgi:hypothetical protein